MKIATYDVNGINGRLPVLLRWLDLAQPDIVVKQELKTSQDRFPAASIREAGYDAIWLGQTQWNGEAPQTASYLLPERVFRLHIKQQKTPPSQ